MEVSTLISPEKFPAPELDLPLSSAPGEATAVVAGGCFWCVEAVYQQLNGGSAVVNGYVGDSAETADYETVCSGVTDHAEAVEIHYDPSRLSYGQLLRVFFSIAHDPTQKDRQGPDVGRQYRSAIFFANDDQKRVAEAYVRQLQGAKGFDAPIVTEIVPLDRFYEAEPYHQDYAERNPMQPYIFFNAMPKVKKVREYYREAVKR